MKNAILEKLKDELNQPILTERQVVYILVEIRKYLEQDSRLLKRYPALNFYCCWAVHSKATGLGADRILQRFDDAYPHFRNGDTPGPLLKKIFATIRLIKFKDDLSDFLTTTHLPRKFIDTSPYWVEFLRLYHEITADCPMYLSTNSSITLSHITHLKVVSEPLPQEAQASVNPPMLSTVWILYRDNQPLAEFSQVFHAFEEIPFQPLRRNAPQTPTLPPD